MNKKRVKTRLLAFTLAVAMVGSSFLGCGKKDSQTKTIMDKDYVYKAEYFEVPEGMINISQLKVSNDRVYIDGYSAENGHHYIIYSMNPDGTDAKVVYEQKPEDASNVNTFAVDAEGNLYYIKTEYVEDKSNPENAAYKNKNLLVKTDPEGKELLSVALKGKEEFSPSEILIGTDGSMFMLCNESMEVFDKDGKSTASIDTSRSNIDRVFITEEGKILATAYSQDYSSREIKEYLPEEKKFSEPIPTPIEGIIFDYSFSSGIGYDLLMWDSMDIYGYDMETKEKTKILNWIDSDINGSAANMITPLSDGRILLINKNYMKNPATTEIVQLTKVAPEDVIEKTVLSLATMHMDLRINLAVIDFNKKSDTHRITIKDYSVYNTEDDYTAGANKLNTDIISGDVPDILNVNDTTSFQNFVSKGLFLDINKMMKKDKDFNRSEYLENIFDAFEEDGNLYSLVPFFEVFSMVGKTAHVGEEMGWTMDDLKNLLASKPEGTKLFEDMTQSQIMYYGHHLYMDLFIDWKKSTSNFDTQEFKDLLEFAKQFPADTENMEMGMMGPTDMIGGDSEHEETLYKKDKVLLQESFLFSFADFHYLQKVIFGEDITFIGFPTADKNGSAITPSIQLAISSTTAAQDAAWDFLKSFLSDEFQDDLLWGWPTNLSSLEKKKQKEQKPQTFTDENGNEVEYEETYVENGKNQKLGVVTDEECEKVITFLKSLTQVMRYDEKVYNIMEEEAAAYFTGQKSVDETAKLIQNRIQTYLSESQ